MSETSVITNKHTFDINIQDGFQDYFLFKQHRLNIRGFNIVDFGFDRHLINQESAKKQVFISWDVKQLYLWDVNLEAPIPQLVKQIKFPQPNFLSAMIISQKMKVFVASALDASFKIYDKKLNLLESIRHEERAILQLEYDNKKDIILAAGASGVSVWRMYRNVSLDKAFVMEKMYSFEECSEWVGKMIYEPNLNRIYAIQDSNAKILSLITRSLVEELENTHDAPLNCICWYERNQFYITGCSRGEIKCWSSHHNSIMADPSATLNTSTMNPALSRDGKTRFALFHVFQGHTKAVTSILLHPTPGLAITTGMDGVIKVLNLEALNELFNIHLEDGILEMKLVELNNHKKGLLLSQTKSSIIRFMKVSTTTKFFGTCNSDIKYLEKYENIELKTVEKQREFRIERLHQKRLNEAKKQALQANQAESFYLGNIVNELKEEAKQFAVQTEHEVEYNEEEEEKMNESYEYTIKHENIPIGNISHEDKLILAYSSQDVRVFNSKSKMIARMEAEHVVDGIKSICISIYQSLVFCLCDGDRIKIFSLKEFTMPFLKEISIRSSNYGGSASTGDDNEDTGSCLVLIDQLPIYSVRNASNNQKHKKKRNSIGVDMPSYLESFLLVGMRNGTISFLDTLSDSLENQMHFQAHNGIITSMHYRSNRKELFVLGRGLKEASYAIHIWKFPQVEFLYEIIDLFNLSSFGFSPSKELFALGTTLGNIRLFKTKSKELMEGLEDAKVTASIHNAIAKVVVEEINSTVKLHETDIVSISFCDELSVIISSSSDGTIKIWDYRKQLIRSLSLSKPTSGSILNGMPGDVIVVQGTYLLTILKLIWNEGDAIDYLQRQIDPWIEQSLFGLDTTDDDHATVKITNDRIDVEAAATATVVSNTVSEDQKESNQIALSESINNSDQSQNHSAEGDNQQSIGVASSNRTNSIDSSRSNSINSNRNSIINSSKRKSSILQRRETKILIENQLNTIPYNLTTDNNPSNNPNSTNTMTNNPDSNNIITTSNGNIRVNRISSLTSRQHVEDSKDSMLGKNHLHTPSQHISSHSHSYQTTNIILPNQKQLTNNPSAFSSSSSSLFSAVTNQFQEAFMTQKKPIIANIVGNNKTEENKSTNLTLFEPNVNFPKLVVIRPLNNSNNYNQQSIKNNINHISELNSSIPSNSDDQTVVHEDANELIANDRSNNASHNKYHHHTMTKQSQNKCIDVMHPRYLIRTKLSVRDSDLLYNELEKTLHFVAMKSKKVKETNIITDNNDIVSSISTKEEEQATASQHISNATKTEEIQSNNMMPLSSRNTINPKIKSWNIRQKFAQLSLSPRARLTLLSSHSLGLGADANEELESIMYNTATMQIGSSYRQHIHTIEEQKEITHKQLYKKPGGFMRSRDNSGHGATNLAMLPTKKNNLTS